MDIDLILQNATTFCVAGLVWFLGMLPFIGGFLAFGRLLDNWSTKALITLSCVVGTLAIGSLVAVEIMAFHM